MSELVSRELKWFSYRQNNSGGYYIQNDVVSQNIFIQAESAAEANKIALRITEDFGEFCDCCGERWCIDADDDDGYGVPSLYGEPINGNHHRFTSEGILYHFDGRVEKRTYPEFIRE